MVERIPGKNISPVFCSSSNMRKPHPFCKSMSLSCFPGSFRRRICIGGNPAARRPGHVTRNHGTRIEIRIRRQRLLEQRDTTNGYFIVDEAAIDRLAGEPDIAQGQIVRLVELANRPNITIEVIPFTAGLHRGLLEPFIILEFADTEDSDVLFLETSKDMIISHDEAGEITGYREVFEELSRISLGRDGTLAYLANLAKRIQ